MISKLHMIFFVVGLLLFTSNYSILAEGPPVITLQEGLKIVTKESRVVKIAKFQEEISESDSHIVRSALFPIINASAVHTSLSNQPALVYNGVAIPSSDQRYLSYGISIQQLLFDFRGSLSRYEASQMLLEAKKLESAEVRNSIAFQFILAFYDFLESQYLVETAKQEIDRLESHLRDANSRFKSGVITRNDLLQAQVRLSDARQKLLSAENLKSVQAARINNLLLKPLQEKFQAMEGEKTVEPPTALELDDAWKKAAIQRLEIRIVDATIKSIDYERIYHQAGFFPKIYVKGANEYMENSYLLHEHSWSLMVGMDINLFEGGKSMAELQKNKIRKKQLLEQRARLSDEIKLELQSRILDQQNAYARIVANKDAVSQGRENLRINQNRYKAGEGTATEVLDAVSLLTIAETNHVRSLYDYRKSEAAVHYAMGEDLLDVYGTSVGQ